MQKKHIKNKIDLCLDAYENDLKKVKSKTPLVFVDKETKKFKLEIFQDITQEEKKDETIFNKNKDFDITYLINATVSMRSVIKSVNDYIIQIFEELKNKYKEFNFKFGAVFYRDIIDCESDKAEYFPLTNDIEDLKNKISKIEAKGGGDIAGDWVEGYDISLNQMNWRNGIKLIIHIADAGAHGKEFSRDDKYDKEGPKLVGLIQ